MMITDMFTAILSFVAAFFLVRFRVNEASRQELKVEIKEAIERSNGGDKSKNDDAPDASNIAEKLKHIDPEQLGHIDPSQLKNFDIDPPIFSSNPEIEAVGPFRRGKPPLHLLEACHTLCMLLSVVGFIMAMVGVLCYVWAMLPSSSRILSTTCLGVCIVSSLLAIFLPQGISLLSPSYVADRPL